MVFALEATELHKRYGRRVALQGLSLRVERGSICGLLGPNGAGKTTTIRSALGFLKPDQGRMTVLGLDCWSQSREVREKIGYCSADMRFYPWMTLTKALSVTSQIRGRSLLEPGLALAARLQLEPNLKIGQMSRGTLQKLGLILAMAPKPELLILDEPSSGLDPLVQATFAEMLKEAQQGGATIVLSSHTFSEVDRLCQVVAIVKQGRVVANEPLSAFRSRAFRQVKLSFSRSPLADPPVGLDVIQRLDQTWEARWRGETGALLRWCADQPILDLEISAPLLDDAFLELYR